MNVPTYHDQYKNFQLENLVEEKYQYETFALNNPNVHKFVLTVFQLLRLLPMIALVNTMPFTAINCTLMLAASIAYRLVAERKCETRFAILSCVGAIAAKIFVNNPSPITIIPLMCYSAFMLDSIWGTTPPSGSKPSETTGGCHSK